jgi:hypothetical protein
VRVWSGGPVPKGSSGITLGSLIILRQGSEGSRYLLAHERVHVDQWRQHGLVGFGLRYVGAYLAWRLRGYPHKAAYRRIPFEVEADWLARRQQAALLAKVADPSWN